jgi:hypothetical protein
MKGEGPPFFSGYDIDARSVNPSALPERIAAARPKLRGSQLAMKVLLLHDFFARMHRSNHDREPFLRRAY